MNIKRNYFTWRFGISINWGAEDKRKKDLIWFQIIFLRINLKNHQ